MSSISPLDEKLERRKAIVDLLRMGDFRTQEDVASEMIRKGFPVTQATISRDLTELPAVKVGGFYRAPDFVGVSPLAKKMAEHGTGVAVAGENLVVLKTELGSAQTVAIELDNAGWKDVVGTVAGDDTIFIAVAGKKGRDAVFGKLKRLIHPGEK